MFSHTFVLVAVTSFTHCYLSALITAHWKVLYMKLKFAPFCSPSDALSDALLFLVKSNY